MTKAEAGDSIMILVSHSCAATTQMKDRVWVTTNGPLYTITYSSDGLTSASTIAMRQNLFFMITS
jgi:ABC-type dipeptide/oligopeptide/nickel transport system ATPase subunit